MIGFDPMVEVATLNSVVLNATELVEGRVWMIEVKLLDNFVQMQVRAWLSASAAECTAGCKAGINPKPTTTAVVCEQRSWTMRLPETVTQLCVRCASRSFAGAC